jgi:hypothetical protein
MGKRELEVEGAIFLWRQHDAIVLALSCFAAVPSIASAAGLLY